MGMVWFVGLGGFLGAVLRYGVSSLLRPTFAGAYPLATLTVNVVGCLAIGALLGFSRTHPGISESTRSFLVVGLLGSFTTFSTFGHETLILLDGQQPGRALLHVVANLLLGLGAVVLGALAVR